MLSGAATDVMHLKRLKDTRKASGQCASVEVTSGNAAFDTKLDNGFAKMIADLKQRETTTTTGGAAAVGQVSDTANDDKQVAAAAASLPVYISSNPVTDQKIQATDSKAEGMDAPSPASLSSSGPPADLSQPALEVAIVRVSYRNNTAPSLPRIPHQKSFSLSPPLFDEDNGNSNDSSVIVLVPTTTALKAPHKPAAAQATPQVTPAAIRKRTPPTMRERIAQPKKRVKVNNNNNDMPSIVAPWTCSHCTFLNKKRKGSRAKCQICENPRECPS
jgi:hypothetical protein